MLRLTANGARVVLSGLILLFGVAVLVRIPKAAPEGIPAPYFDDIDMFKTVVTRLQAGENYYGVMGDELRRGYYPAGSIFNWRTPGLYEIFAALPDWIRSAMFLMVAALVFVLTAIQVRHLGPRLIALALVTQTGVLSTMWPAQMMTETWCGLLVAISAFAYGSSYRRVGVLLGLLALFVRELAAPYCMICVLLAVAGRRRRELILWVVGAAIFALVYYLHVTRVWAHQKPGDVIPLPWVRFGNVRFILETIRQTNWWLARTPAVFTAIFAVLLAASPCAPAIPAHLRAAVIVYAVFFFVVGQTFNDYWGFVTAPMTSVAVAYGYDGIRYVMERSRFT
jgi:hypothetical protein